MRRDNLKYQTTRSENACPYNSCSNFICFKDSNIQTHRFRIIVTEVETFLTVSTNFNARPNKRLSSFLFFFLKFQWKYIDPLRSTLSQRLQQTIAEEPVNENYPFKIHELGFHPSPQSIQPCSL